MPTLAWTNLSDSDLIPEIVKLRPEKENFEDYSIIVDGTPVVGKEKCDLLEKFIMEKFSRFGTVVKSRFPRDEDGQTAGYVFITYDSVKAASMAMKTMNNALLDRNHTLKVNLLKDFGTIMEAEDVYVPPKKQEYNDHGNLKSWLLNEYCRDQFLTLYNDGALGSIYWHTTSEPILVNSRENWCVGWMMWSPRGSYLATAHPLGIALWGGEKFDRIGRFPHHHVQVAEFSPQERFVVTITPNSAASDKSGHQKADFIVWDILRGKSRREMTVDAVSFPVVRWSHDDEYFAVFVNGIIFVYETKTFKLFDKNPIKAQTGISEMAWSPSDNVIAYWVPESDNTPARVALIEIPSRQELCTKNLFSVAQINMVWHPQGDYLAVEVLRCAKRKVDESKQVKYMGTYTNFEIVRMREKLYPVDQLEVKDSVSAFQWEPNGSRFAFLQTSAGSKISIALYDVQKSGNVASIGMLERATSRINDLRWSPNGNIFVVAALKSAEGNLEFIDANECSLLAKVDHSMVSEIYWDPTGRYVASVVSGLFQKNDNCVMFWSCIGRQLHKMTLNGLRHFYWRPRPPCSLSADQQAEVKKNINKYADRFRKEDIMLTSKATRDILERRQRMVASFNAFREKLVKRYHLDEERRKQLRGSNESAENEVLVEEKMDILVNTSTEVLKKFIGE